MSLKRKAKESGLVEYRGKWCVLIDGRRLSTGHEAIEDTLEVARIKAIEKTNEALYTPQGDTIADIYKAYLNDKTDDKTCIDPDRLWYAWKALEPFFGDMLPKEVDRNACRDYADYRDGRAASTINKELRLLRAGLKFGKGPDAGGATFEFLPEPEPRDRFLTREEFQRLLDKCKSPHLRMFCHLAIATAGRKSAILGLTKHMVNLDEGRLWLGVKKNGKRRSTVPLTNALKRELEVVFESNETEFLVEYAGRPVKDVKKAFKRAAEDAGFKDFTIHDLRHTAATWMAGDGVLMEKISTYLGHTRIDITRNVYAKYQPEHLKDAAAALEV